MAASTCPCRRCTGHPTALAGHRGPASTQPPDGPGTNAHTSLPSFMTGRTGRLHLRLPSALCPCRRCANGAAARIATMTFRAKRAQTAIARAPLHQEDEDDVGSLPVSVRADRKSQRPRPSRPKSGPPPPPQLHGALSRSASANTASSYFYSTMPLPRLQPPHDPPGASPARRQRHRGPANSPSLFGDRAWPPPAAAATTVREARLRVVWRLWTHPESPERSDPGVSW
jgi:hypothetical protein